MATDRRLRLGAQLSFAGSAEDSADLGYATLRVPDSFDDLELSSTAYRDGVVAGPGAGFGPDAEKVLGMPDFAIGTVDQVAGERERRRDEPGLLYVVVGGEGHEAMAPVVARLSGT